MSKKSFTLFIPSHVRNQNLCISCNCLYKEFVVSLNKVVDLLPKILLPIYIINNIEDTNLLIKLVTEALENIESHKKYAFFLQSLRSCQNICKRELPLYKDDILSYIEAISSLKEWIKSETFSSYHVISGIEQKNLEINRLIDTYLYHSEKILELINTIYTCFSRFPSDVILNNKSNRMSVEFEETENIIRTPWEGNKLKNGVTIKSNSPFDTIESSFDEEYNTTIIKNYESKEWVLSDFKKEKCWKHMKGKRIVVLDGKNKGTTGIFGGWDENTAKIDVNGKILFFRLNRKIQFIS